MWREPRPIRRKLVQNIFRTFDFAKAAGPPRNFIVVVNFRETPERCAATAFKHVRYKFRKGIESWPQLQA